MIATSIITLVTVLSAATASFGKPISWNNVPAKRSSSPSGPISFNNYGGLSSLSHFDDFNGVNNFDGSQQITVEQTTEVVCEQIDVEIIQQKLVVIREAIKRIITEQICEVETQTLVIEQFSSGIDSFGSDVRHASGRHIGYNSNIAGMIGSLQNSDGSASSQNLNFTGSDASKHDVSISGSNWNNASSPASVGSIYQAAMSAKKSDQISSNSTSAASYSNSTSTATSSSIASSASPSSKA